jgi:hypothetical protein
LLLGSVASAEDFGVRLVLGLTDKAGTTWDGSVTARGCRISGVEPWRFEGDDAIGSGDSWKLSTHPIRLFGGGRQGPPPVVANGVVVSLTDAGDACGLEIKTAQGNFAVRLADIPYGKMLHLLDGRVMADRVPPAARLTTNDEEQDYPAAVTHKGELWIAWMEFKHHPEHDRLRSNFTEAPKDHSERMAASGGDTIFVRRWAAGAWGDPIAVTKGGEDLYRPSISVDSKGRPWVFWSANPGGPNPNFDVWACPIENGRPGAAVRVSNVPGSDIDPVSVADASGRVWVAWQGWRNGRAGIFAAVQQGDKFTTPSAISASTGNEWNPAIAADTKGRVTVAWDSYRNGNYDVFYRTATGPGAWGSEMALASSTRYEAYPTLAYEPSGRLWVAYEEGSERWGKDMGADESSGVSIYYGRVVRLRALETDGRLLEAAADLGEVLPGNASQRVDQPGKQTESDSWLKPSPEAWRKRGPSQATPVALSPRNTSPKLHVDASGRLWLAARSPHPIWWSVLGTVWSEYVISYDGDRWTGPVFLMHSDNLLDNRPALVSLQPGELTVIGSSDGRRQWLLDGQLPRLRPNARGNVIVDPYNNDLWMNTVVLAPRREQLAVKPAQPASGSAPDSEDKIERAAIAGIRTARVGGKYKIVRGEFHRHSEISMDGGRDGSILDQWRYMVDAAGMEWAGCCDHDNGSHREYSWWITQKQTDIFYSPGHFVPMFSYERSVSYPEGHRNVIFKQRGVRTLPRLPIMKPDSTGKAPDTAMLYDYLRQFNGVVAVHTSGTNMGTDWRDNDTRVEPMVEIYQGERQNYERPEAPRTNRESDSIGGWRPKGFVNLALEMGYKLAFQASSDHISTHMSYCNILATDHTREAILDAFQKRHIYGSTDNILADFRCGSYIMGDAFSLPTTPELKVKLSGTAPFAKVHIIKDNKYVYTTEPKQTAVEFAWRDNAPARGKTSYYYVRGEQEDGEVVWVSPMWITYTGK